MTLTLFATAIKVARDRHRAAPGWSAICVEYDTVSDRYARFLHDDLLPEVYAKYNIRRDAYSRAITGLSSGGICAFNVAWQQPDQFSRVLSWIGSFTPLQTVPNYGGQAFPAMVLREPMRNIRVWLQDAKSVAPCHGFCHSSTASTLPIRHRL